MAIYSCGFPNSFLSRLNLSADIVLKGRIVNYIPSSGINPNGVLSTANVSAFDPNPVPITTNLNEGDTVIVSSDNFYSFMYLLKTDLINLVILYRDPASNVWSIIQ